MIRIRQTPLALLSILTLLLCAGPSEAAENHRPRRPENMKAHVQRVTGELLDAVAALPEAQRAEGQLHVPRGVLERFFDTLRLARSQSFSGPAIAQWIALAVDNDALWRIGADPLPGQEEGRSLRSFFNYVRASLLVALNREALKDLFAQATRPHPYAIQWLAKLAQQLVGHERAQRTMTEDTSPEILVRAAALALVLQAESARRPLFTSTAGLLAAEAALYRTILRAQEVGLPAEAIALALEETADGFRAELEMGAALYASPPRTGSRPSFPCS